VRKRKQKRKQNVSTVEGKRFKKREIFVRLLLVLRFASLLTDLLSFLISTHFYRVQLSFPTSSIFSPSSVLRFALVRDFPSVVLCADGCLLTATVHKRTHRTAEIERNKRQLWGGEERK
jgi:hypothetical protein